MEKLIKSWSSGFKEMVRQKPGLAPNDYLDELAEQAAEWERANHEAGDCQRDCPHCRAETDADLETFWKEGGNR